MVNIYTCFKVQILPMLLCLSSIIYLKGKKFLVLHYWYHKFCLAGPAKGKKVKRERQKRRKERDKKERMASLGFLSLFFYLFFLGKKQGARRGDGWLMGGRQEESILIIESCWNPIHENFLRLNLRSGLEVQFILFEGSFLFFFFVLCFGDLFVLFGGVEFGRSRTIYIWTKYLGS